MNDNPINDTEGIREELEREYTMRFTELNQFEAFVEENGLSEEFCNSYRKMLIVMLYAYYEGYCKKALEIYAEYINSSHEKVKDVKVEIASATLHLEFKRLEDKDHHPVRLLGNVIRQDSKIQKYGRRCEFFQAYEQQMEKQVRLPDDIVDTESNLKSHVLKSLMYKLSLDYTVVDQWQGIINRLTNLRNSIAHGDIVREINKDEYDECKTAILDVMNSLKQEIITNYGNKGYLKPSA